MICDKAPIVHEDALSIFLIICVWFVDSQLCSLSVLPSIEYVAAKFLVALVTEEQMVTHK